MRFGLITCTNPSSQFAKFCSSSILGFFGGVLSHQVAGRSRIGRGDVTILVLRDSGAASAVGVAQLVERRSVAPNVAGSIPVSHPKFPQYLPVTSIPRRILPKNCRLHNRRVGSELFAEGLDAEPGIFDGAVFFGFFVDWA
jgi:hypothetical protein